MNIIILMVSASSVGAFIVGGLFALLMMFFLGPGLFPEYLKSQQRLIDDEYDSKTRTFWVNPGDHAYEMYFFLGQSGCGKDTQVGKFLQLLQEQKVKYIYVSIGDSVRGMIDALGENSHFIRRMKSVNDLGKLQPPAIPLHFFLSKFIPEYTGEEMIVVNGSPRSDKELELWSRLIKEGYLPNATILHLDVTDDECRNRLVSRQGRADTQNAQSLENKLAWYQPVRKWLTQKLPIGVRVVTINGMNSIDETAQEIHEFFVDEDVLIRY